MIQSQSNITKPIYTGRPDLVCGGASVVVVGLSAYEGSVQTRQAVLFSFSFFTFFFLQFPRGDGLLSLSVETCRRRIAKWVAPGVPGLFARPPSRNAPALETASTNSQRGPTKPRHGRRSLPPPPSRHNPPNFYHLHSSTYLEKEEEFISLIISFLSYTFLLKEEEKRKRNELPTYSCLARLRPRPRCELTPKAHMSMIYLVGARTKTVMLIIHATGCFCYSPSCLPPSHAAAGHLDRLRQRLPLVSALARSPLSRAAPNRDS